MGSPPDTDGEALYKNLGWYSESDYKSMTAVNSLDYADEVQTAPYTDATPMGSPPDTDRDRYAVAQAMRENKASATIAKHLKKHTDDRHDKEMAEQAIKIQAVQRGKQDRKLVQQKMEAKKEHEEQEHAATKIQALRRGQVGRRGVDSGRGDNANEEEEQKASVGFRGLQALSESKQREGEPSTEQQASTEDFTVVQTVQQVRRVKLPVKHKGKLVMREFVVVDHHHIHHHHHFHHDAQAQQDHKEQMRSLEYKAQASVDPPPPTSLPVGQGGKPQPPKEAYSSVKGAPKGGNALKGPPNAKPKKGGHNPLPKKAKPGVLPPIAH